MVFDAMLIALFVVLSLLNVRIGNVFKIGFSSFATIVAAVLLGPADGFIVGFAGEFLEQMLTYGLTPTTILYLLGPGARGLVLGAMLIAFSKGRTPLQTALDKKHPQILVSALLLSSFAQTVLNTLANYVDSKLYGWYSFEVVFGSFLARTVLGFLQTFVFAGLAIAVLHALRNSKLVPFPQPKKTSATV
jgi:ECF transporter S component (folate family)